MVYLYACEEHRQTGLSPQPWLDQISPTHPAADTDQRESEGTTQETLHTIIYKLISQKTRINTWIMERDFGIIILNR